MKGKEDRKKKEANVNNTLRRKQQWEQSEAVYHMQEKDARKTEPYLKGFSDKERDVKKPGRMREIFKAENSYGAIAAGVNKKKEAAVVFSQKREHDGPVAAESQKNLHMERAKRQILPAGNMYLNPDMQKEGAAAFLAKKELPAKKAMAQLQRYSDEKGSRMMEQRMPFLELREERAQAASLEQQRRKSRETGDRNKAQLLEDRVQQMKSRIARKEQEKRQMMKKLREAWKKAQRMPSDDFHRQDEVLPEQMQEENMQEQPESENTRDEEIRGNDASLKSE